MDAPGAAQTGVFEGSATAADGETVTLAQNLAGGAGAGASATLDNTSNEGGTGAAEAEGVSAEETAGTAADAPAVDDEGLKADVLGERVAPITQAVEDGSFDRSMLFDEEAKKIPFPIWFLFFALGAAGVGIYQKVRSRRKN